MCGKPLQFLKFAFQMIRSLNNKQIDLINIVLIIISLIIAIFIPFKLFLFSYAVLGPLHYLTELNWLQTKNFFISNSKKWSIPLLVLSFIIGLYGILILSNLLLPSSLEYYTNLIQNYYSAIILAAFLFAVALILIKNQIQLLLAMFIAVAVSLLINFVIPQWIVFVGVFLPTLIHVYFFTAFFMYYGAKKAKSKPGYLSCVVLLFVPFVISYLPVQINQYEFTESTLSTYVSSNMHLIIQEIANAFAVGSPEKFELISTVGIKIQIFIAFAYTYHYLNWFSKTSLIGWEKTLSKKKAISILAIWALSVAIYYWNFKTGFMALFLLSILHVFLEFPLNVITIRQLFSK
jgi:hypothetical protein